jgi:methionyl-tRNA synthetase
MKKALFITTAIDYPSSDPHLGHAYEKIVTDVIARWARLRGYEVHFSTGTDEHGLKIQRAAQRMGKAPLEFVNDMSKKFRQMCEKLNISFTDFIRTTEPRHVRVAQTVFQKLREAGDVYKGTYRGPYCVDCESYYTEKDLIDGKCPVHRKATELIEEESYFFRMSKYRQRLIEHIRKHPEFIQPEAKRREILARLRAPLRDLSISRVGVEWGIRVPFDERHTQYVWVDALSNYLTTAGYPSARFRKWWPALHLIGSDIVWHHSVIWGSILLSLGLKLPRILVHGFITVKGQKLSKALGIVIDPLYLTEKYSADALRYFLLRDIAFGQDGDFSEEALQARLNGELVANIGNFIHRTLTFIWNQFDGKVPRAEKWDELDRAFEADIKKVARQVGQELERFRLDVALRRIVEFSTRCNRYFQQRAPWQNPKQAPTCLYLCVNAVRSLAILLEPYVPAAAATLWGLLRLGGSVHTQSWDSASRLVVKAGHQIGRPHVLFKKVKTKPEVGEKMIEFGDFKRVEMKVGTVVTAEKVAGTEKLLKLQVDFGTERRQAVAGIAHTHRPEQLVGRQFVFVTNLKPVRLRGELSECMILAAVKDEEEIVLIGPERRTEAGMPVE